MTSQPHTEKPGDAVVAAARHLFTAGVMPTQGTRT